MACERALHPQSELVRVRQLSLALCLCVPFCLSEVGLQAALLSPSRGGGDTGAPCSELSDSGPPLPLPERFGPHHRAGAGAPAALSAQGRAKRAVW